MNKELIPTLVLILALFGAALYYFESIQRPFLSLLSFTKSTYLETMESIEYAIDEHFDQQNTIKKLRSGLIQHKKDQLIIRQLMSENSALFHANNSSFTTHPDVDLVRVLSYAKFGDHRKLWLQMKDFNASKVYGLVYNEVAAGIIVNTHNQPMALLNGDLKSSYAVFVGEKLAPGIIHGNNSDQLLVKFIPTWIPIKKGDEVVTSGLDNLFFHGLKVGKVISVTLSQGYQDAVIEPYYKADKPAYFHVIKQLR